MELEDLACLNLRSDTFGRQLRSGKARVELKWQALGGEKPPAIKFYRSACVGMGSCGEWGQGMGSGNKS